MKKSIKCLAALSILAAVFASCQKSEAPVANQNKTGHVFIYASAPDASKVAYNNDDPSTLQLTGWNEGDTLNLYKVETGSTKSVSDAIVFRCTDATTGRFEAWLKDTDPTIDELNYATTGTMKLVGTGNTAKIQVYPAKQASTNVEDVILLIGARDLQGEYAMTINGTILEITNNSGDAIEAAVKCGNTTWNYGIPCVLYYNSAFYGKTDEIALTNFDDAKFSLATGKNYVFMHTGDESNYVGLSKSDDADDMCSIAAKKWFGSFNQPEAGSYFTCSYPAAVSPLTKKSFKVSETKSVKFTKGNLYWDGSNYQLEDEQIDFPTTWNANHVGHFYWSSSEEVARSTSYVDPAASTADTFFASGITIGETSGLYTLTNKEWHYLIQNSINKNGVVVKYEAGDTDGVSCLVIANSDYSGSIADTLTLDQVNTNDFVCLPYAGGRSGNSISEVDDWGYCWTASPYPTNAQYAYFVAFYEGGIYSETGGCDGYPRNSAFPIRLVK